VVGSQAFTAASISTDVSARRAGGQEHVASGSVSPIQLAIAIQIHLAPV
jgi:hypothetical protein